MLKSPLGYRKLLIDEDEEISDVLNAPPIHTIIPKQEIAKRIL